MDDQEVSDLRQMWDLLMRDVIECQEEALNGAGEKLAYWRRIYTRTVFSAIEGACTMFKSQAFVAAVNKAFKEGSYQLGKLSVLAGETYIVTEKGEIKALPLRTSFLNDMLFALQSYQEAQNVTHRTIKGEQWSRVLKALSVRHRITHPKNTKSLEITDTEIRDVSFTLHWFLGEITAVFVEKGFKNPFETDGEVTPS